MRLLRRLEAIGSDMFDAIESDGRSCFRSSFTKSDVGVIRAICGAVMVVSLSVVVVDDTNEVEGLVVVRMAASW